jgi:hypothetical protein
MGGVPDEEWITLYKSFKGCVCLLDIVTNNGLWDITREAGLPMSVMTHL